MCLRVRVPVSVTCVPSFSHVSSAPPPQPHFSRVGCPPKAIVTLAPKTKSRRHSKRQVREERGSEEQAADSRFCTWGSSSSSLQPLGLQLLLAFPVQPLPDYMDGWSLRPTSQKAVLAVSPHHHPTSPSLRVRQAHLSSVSSLSSKQRVKPPAGEATELQR